MGGAIGLLYSQWVAKRKIGRETKIREKRVIFLYYFNELYIKIKTEMLGILM